MKLKLLVLLFTSVIFFTSTPPVQAISKFSTSIQSTYQININGTTHVRFLINQKNNLSSVYATEYSFAVNHTQVENIRVYDQGTPIQPEITKSQNQTLISFAFINRVAGVGKNHLFIIEYDTQDIAYKYGYTWQINIPRMDPNENLIGQTIQVIIPEELGSVAYIDPQPANKINNSYYFTDKELGNKSISAIIGKEQYYQAVIQYHLENTSSKAEQQSITIPPETSYQEIYIKDIQPAPKKYTTDTDGNILAIYEINPKTNVDVKLEQYFKLSLTPKSTELINTQNYLKSNQIIDYDNSIFNIPEINNLKTSKNIYDYVVDKLNYDYQKTLNSNPVMPASESFTNPDNAICTDFTNLFITLSRKNNIPAREIQGYAFSENQNLMPLSLKQDILHSWPEFYDQNKKTWIQVDPTWAKTTHGANYYDKLDFGHLAFVIHGENPLSPATPGTYKLQKQTKDIQVTPISAIEFPKPDVTIKNLNQKKDLLNLEIQNLTGVSFEGEVSIKNQQYLNDYNQKIKILPFNEITLSQTVQNQPLILPTATKVIINLNHHELEYEIKIKPKIPTFALLTGTILLLGTASFYAWYIRLRRHKSTPPLYR